MCTHIYIYFHIYIVKGVLIGLVTSKDVRDKRQKTRKTFEHERDEIRGSKPPETKHTRQETRGTRETREMRDTRWEKQETWESRETRDKTPEIRDTRHETRDLKHEEGTGTRPDYLVNRADKKIEEPFGEQNCTKIEKQLVCERSGMWVHRHSWLKAQICAILQPNTNAQRMSFSSLLLSSGLAACGRDCYSLLRSL